MGNHKLERGPKPKTPNYSSQNSCYEPLSLPNLYYLILYLNFKESIIQNSHKASISSSTTTSNNINTLKKRDCDSTFISSELDLINSNNNNTKLDNAFRPISIQDQQKIESFYQSFGTSIFTSKSYACLYTMPNFKTLKPITPAISTTTTTTTNNKHILNNSNNNLSKRAKRHSSINPASISPTQFYSNTEIDTNIVSDFLHNKHKNYVSVYHRGIPLWLFNSGKNPRRSSRQLKFTLAERGTGFILWQDRIDSASDFKIHGLSKNTHETLNLSHYFESASSSDLSLDHIESILITFKASDKKTTVFLKFDLDLETIKFYEHYKEITKNLGLSAASTRSRAAKDKTRSLPPGVGAAQHLSSKKYAQEYLKNEMNLIQNEQNLRLKCKKITKKDISAPLNLKHVINLTSHDRESFYTLSKLLPVAQATTTTSTIQVNCGVLTSAKSISPTSSTTSSSSSSSSSSAYMNSVTSSSFSTSSTENAHLNKNLTNKTFINQKLNSKNGGIY